MASKAHISSGEGCGCEPQQAGMSEELEWELYDIFESGLFAFPIWDHSSARKIVQYLLDRGVLGEEIADAIEDSTYDLDIWLNRGGKHMVGEWIIAWINECREEYDAEKLQEQYEEAYLQCTPQSSDHSDSEDDYGSDSEVRQLTQVHDLSDVVDLTDYEARSPLPEPASSSSAYGTIGNIPTVQEPRLQDEERLADDGAVRLQPPPLRASWRREDHEMHLTDGEEEEEEEEGGARWDSEDGDGRDDHPPKNAGHGVVTKSEDPVPTREMPETDEVQTHLPDEGKQRAASARVRFGPDVIPSFSRPGPGGSTVSGGDTLPGTSRADATTQGNTDSGSRSMCLTVTASGATSSSQPQKHLAIPDPLRGPGSSPPPHPLNGSSCIQPKLIPIKCSMVPPPGSPGFISHLEKTGLPICPNCTCKFASYSVDKNDNNCIDLYLSQSPAMEVGISTLDRDGPGFIFILTDCLTQCLPWNTACRYKVTSSREPERCVQPFSKQNIAIEIIWQIKVQHHILAVKEVHTYLSTFRLHTNWFKCPLKVIVETVSKVAKRFREE